MPPPRMSRSNAAVGHGLLASRAGRHGAAHGSSGRPSYAPMRSRQSSGTGIGLAICVVVGHEHRCDSPTSRPSVAVMRWLIAMLDRPMRSTCVATSTSSPNMIGRAEVELDAGQDQRHALERFVRLEDVEQVPDPGQLDVAEEDRVVDVPERIGVAKAHLQGRAVAEVIGHGAAILAGGSGFGAGVYTYIREGSDRLWERPERLPKLRVAHRDRHIQPGRQGRIACGRSREFHGPNHSASSDAGGSMVRKPMRATASPARAEPLRRPPAAREDAHGVDGEGVRDDHVELTSLELGP